MANKFEENLGKYTFIDLATVTDYLAISSNTYDARLSNIIHYATGVVEHYIGQEVLANDYIEVLDGGSSYVYTSRLPLSNVYQVEEYNGTSYNRLADPDTLGLPITNTSPAVLLDSLGDPQYSTIKKTGDTSVKFTSSDLLYTNSVPDSLKFEESDFTIEAYVRIDNNTLSDNTLFSINTDNNNYLSLGLANQYGIALTSNVNGVTTTIQGANSLVESQQFSSRKWAHIAVSRKLDDEKIYLHYNGNTIANASFTESNLTFTSNVIIGEGLVGYLDELRVSTIARYTDDFVPATHRFRPDSDTAVLFHFDDSFKDCHSTPSDFTFSRGSGRISKNYGNPTLSLLPTTAFNNYSSGVKISYRAGYEINEVPYDIKLATLDYIKILYKQTQNSKGFTFSGEKGASYSLSSNFPPHVRRVLDMYRTIM